MNIDMIRDHAELIEHQRDLKSQLDDIKRSIARSEEAVVGEMIDNGVDSLPISLEGGGKLTLYIKRQKWPKMADGINREDVVAALLESGDETMSDLVAPGYNANSLAAYLRELDAEGVDFPEGISKVLSLSERVTVGSRKSG